MATQTPIRGRLAELLAAEAADGIVADEQVELDRLLGQAPPADRNQMLQVAALAQMAFLKRDPASCRAMAAAIREKLARLSAAWQAGCRTAAATPVADLELARRRREDQRRPAEPAMTQSPGNRSSRMGALGWYAAAALAVAVVVLRLTPSPAPPVPVAEVGRATLIDQAADAVRTSWGPSAEPGFENATGDVVWSSARQEGYMRLAGLPANDRSREQYQLWVVDPERDARPVDGGVFDIDAKGEVIVPIQAKLPVGRPAAFAITLEKAGGVVISDGPMLLVAAVGS